jgi:hypothetical protein
MDRLITDQVITARPTIRITLDRASRSFMDGASMAHGTSVVGASQLTPGAALGVNSLG